MPREPREGEVYEPVPGWDSAYQQVMRMVARKEILYRPCKFGTPPKVIPQEKRLLMQSKDSPPSYQKWGHEIARGDCYVALHKTGKLTGYRSKWSKDEYQTFSRQHGVNFDSHFDLQDSPFTFFLEVDMGTEYWEGELAEKVQEYAGLAQSMPKQPFYALFVAYIREGVSRSDRLKAFGRCFQTHGRRQNFLVTDIELFKADPLGDIWASAKFDKPVRLLSLLL